MTSFYMFRLIYLTFFGESRLSHEAEHHVHESPKSMTMPLVALAICSVFAGYLGLPQSLGGTNRFEKFLSPVFASEAQTVKAEAAAVGKSEGRAHTEPSEYALMLLSVGAAIGGWFMASRAYGKAAKGYKEPIQVAAPPVYSTLLNKYYVDEAYDYAFTGRKKLGPVRLGAIGLGEASWKFDANVIDGYGERRRLDYALQRGAVELVGQVDHRRRAGEWSGDSGAIAFLSHATVRVGTGAVVRAGHGSGSGRIRVVLRDPLTRNGLRNV